MDNPFLEIDQRLSKIEKLLLELVKPASETKKTQTPANELRLMPITELFARKVISKPTFYSHVRSGSFPLYKLGARSYVDPVEFEKAFKKVVIN